MYKILSSLTSFENIVKSGQDVILLCDKNTQKEIFLSLKTDFIFGNFFISENISGELYETSFSNVYILKSKNNIYVSLSQNYDALLLQHYDYTLQHDIISCREYHEEKNIDYSQDALSIYEQQVEAFGKNCKIFLQSFSLSNRHSYEYIQSWKTLISLYASLRSSFQGNAESFYDSQKSNSFLLLGNHPVNVSKYIREKTWITTEYEQYVYQLLDSPNKSEYNMTLTTSGISSLNLVLRYFSTKKLTKILIIGEIYFENILILQDHFGKENIHFLKIENISQDIGKYIKKNTIDAVFFDSVSISFRSEVFTKESFDKLMKDLIKENCSVDIVIDTTTKYLSLLDYTAPKDFTGSVFYIGSLIKHIAGGIDIMSGGYVLTPRKEIDLCTMIPRIDADIGTMNALKIPILPKSRHKEIITDIHSCLEKTYTIYKKQLKFPQNIQVQFPKSIASEEDLKDFQGCLINISLRNSKNLYKLFPQYIGEFQEVLKKKILEENIDVSYSIGYGYYNTRVVLFCLDKIEEKYNGAIPYYIRISVGYTSQSSQVVKLMNISGQVLSFFEKKYC